MFFLKHQSIHNPDHLFIIMKNSTPQFETDESLYNSTIEKNNICLTSH